MSLSISVVSVWTLIPSSQCLSLFLLSPSELLYLYRNVSSYFWSLRTNSYTFIAMSLSISVVSVWTHIYLYRNVSPYFWSLRPNSYICIAMSLCISEVSVWILVYISLISYICNAPLFITIASASTTGHMSLYVCTLFLYLYSSVSLYFFVSLSVLLCISVFRSISVFLCISVLLCIAAYTSVLYLSVFLCIYVLLRTVSQYSSLTLYISLYLLLFVYLFSLNRYMPLSVRPWVSILLYSMYTSSLICVSSLYLRTSLQNSRPYIHTPVHSLSIMYSSGTLQSSPPPLLHQVSIEHLADGLGQIEQQFQYGGGAGDEHQGIFHRRRGQQSQVAVAPGACMYIGRLAK